MLPPFASSANQADFALQGVSFEILVAVAQNVFFRGCSFFMKKSAKLGSEMHRFGVKPNLKSQNFK